MKALFLPLALFLGWVCTACHSDTNNSAKNRKVFVVDVSKAYPKKKLVLQDIADIRYIPVETSDEFLCSSGPKVITKGKIIFPEYKSGDILVYDTNGKALNKFNRRGNGAEEYSNPSGLLYDESTEELFVKSTPSKMNIYTLEGKFLRSVSIEGNRTFDNIYILDNDNLLCFSEKDSIQVYTFSRKDGSITHEIPIPFEKKIEPFVSREATSGPTTSRTFLSSIQKDKDGFLIQTISSDIAYRLTPSLELVPVMERTPALKDMQTPVILEYGPDSQGYAFFSTVKMTFDWEKMTGFPRSFLYLDKSTGEVFEQEIVNTDFEGQPGILLSNFFSTCDATPGTGSVWLFTHTLKQANDEGKLSGRLKKIVDEMDDDDNGIVMLATFK